MQRSKKKVKIPQAYSEDDGGYLNDYVVETMEYKTVYDYTGLNFEKQNDLTIIEFYKLLRDGFIYKMKQSEAGRSYLDDCWLMEQTKADRGQLRDLIRKEVNE